MRKVFLVTVRWVKTTQNNEMIDAVLGQHGDWLRFNGYTWFVASDKTPTDLRVAVMSKLTPDDSVIVAPLAPGGPYDGFAPKWIWDWFSTRLGPSTGS